MKDDKSQVAPQLDLSLLEDPIHTTLGASRLFSLHLLSTNPRKQHDDLREMKKDKIIEKMTPTSTGVFHH